MVENEYLIPQYLIDNSPGRTKSHNCVRFGFGSSISVDNSKLAGELNIDSDPIDANPIDDPKSSALTFVVRFFNFDPTVTNIDKNNGLNIFDFGTKSVKLARETSEDRLKVQFDDVGILVFDIFYLLQIFLFKI